MSEIELIVLWLFLGFLMGFIGGVATGAIHEMNKCIVRMKMFARHHRIDVGEDEE